MEVSNQWSRTIARHERNGDWTEARSVLENAARTSPEAMLKLSKYLECALGGAQDFGRAKVLLEKAAALGNGCASYLLAVRYLQERSSKSSSRSLRWMRKAAAQGIPDAHFMIGEYYRAQHDPGQALSWYMKAHKLGYFKGAYGAALIHLYSRFKGAKRGEGVRLLELAAAEGDTDALYELGRLREEGRLCAKDAKEALRLYKAAARAGDDEAALNAGVCYLEGREGVPQNLRRALEWHLRSAAGGNLDAMYNLGLIYRDTSLRDRRASTRWLKKAADQGHRLASRQLEN